VTDSWRDQNIRKLPSGFKINQSVEMLHKSGRYPNDFYEGMNTMMLHLFKEETVESTQNTRVRLRGGYELTAGINQQGFLGEPCPHFHLNPSETRSFFSVSFPLIR